MPDPALYVVVRRGRHEFRLDRSGALSLPASLFDGPDAWRDPKGRVEAEPYDEVWASGGVLLDHDRRLLRWYNRQGIANDSAGLRRAVLPLLGWRWPGWTVEHADHGYVDVIAGLPVDGGTLLMPDRPLRGLTIADLVAGMNAPSGVLGRPLSLDEYVAAVDPFEHLSHLRGYELTVVSVRDVEGTVRDHVGGMSLTPLLATGPELLTMLRDLPTVTVPGEQYVDGGVFVDVAGRTVTAWQGRSGRLASARLAERWPGWLLSVHHEGLPGHLRRSGRNDAPLRLPWRTVLAEACLMFDHDVGRAEKDFAALLRDGAAWPGRPGLTGRRLAVLHRLCVTRSGADPGPDPDSASPVASPGQR
ncbi:hypothetical protein I0C86_15000 [Plantactinospora sp. S1510]|uniref:Uncharacterized protein n=1 Tax=Plantactinospora alkalitolerans TaxID=2789879 RepID=A0ABS0GW91_9ACTN|nr:hypothetical protein [Plantactinospora alkalitolerans]MBF9130253.1 hypothetical protein [Plantactinospora alkalitolerans]